VGVAVADNTVSIADGGLAELAAAVN